MLLVLSSALSGHETRDSILKRMFPVITHLISYTSHFYFSLTFCTSIFNSHHRNIQMLTKIMKSKIISSNHCQCPIFFHSSIHFTPHTPYWSTLQIPYFSFYVPKLRTSLKTNTASPSKEWTIFKYYKISSQYSSSRLRFQSFKDLPSILIKCLLFF